MNRYILNIFICIILHGCTSKKKMLLDSFFFSDKKTVITSIDYFKIKLHYKEVTYEKSNQIDTEKVVNDSAVIIGNNQKYCSYTKSGIHYNDSKYFFNFSNNRAIYGDVKKLNGFGFLNVIDVLRYINENFSGYEMSNLNKELLIVTLKDNNALNCDNVYITLNNKNAFRVSQISYFVKSKDNKVNVKINLFIDEVILNDSTVSKSPLFKNFYLENENNINLIDSLKKYKLTKVY